MEDVADRTPAPVGIYRAKIVKADPKKSKNGNAMIEVQLNLTHDAGGKKLKSNEFGDVWTYPISDHDHPFVQAQWKEFLMALGLKTKGVLDTDKIVGTSIQVKLKSDTDQDGDYRPRVGKMMALADAKDEAPEDEPEPDEPDEDEEEDDGEDEIDLSELDRTGLKKLIKDEELEIKVTKKMSDEDIREAIAEAMGGDEDEEEDEEEEEDDSGPEPPEDEDEDDGYESMSIADLKAELKERELQTTGAKKILIARLRKDDGSDPF